MLHVRGLGLARVRVRFVRVKVYTVRVRVRVRVMTAFVLNAFLYATRRRGSTRKSG